MSPFYLQIVVFLRDIPFLFFTDMCCGKHLKSAKCFIVNGGEGGGVSCGTTVPIHTKNKRACVCVWERLLFFVGTSGK